MFFFFAFIDFFCYARLPFFVFYWLVTCPKQDNYNQNLIKQAIWWKTITWNITNNTTFRGLFESIDNYFFSFFVFPVHLFVFIHSFCFRRPSAFSLIFIIFVCALIGNNLFLLVIESKKKNNGKKTKKNEENTLEFQWKCSNMLFTFVRWNFSSPFSVSFYSWFFCSSLRRLFNDAFVDASKLKLFNYVRAILCCYISKRLTLCLCPKFDHVFVLLLLRHRLLLSFVLSVCVLRCCLCRNLTMHVTCSPWHRCQMLHHLNGWHVAWSTASLHRRHSFGRVVRSLLFGLFIVFVMPSTKQNQLSFLHASAPVSSVLFFRFLFSSVLHHHQMQQLSSPFRYPPTTWWLHGLKTIKKERNENEKLSFLPLISSDGFMLLARLYLTSHRTINVIFSASVHFCFFRSSHSTASKKRFCKIWKKKMI